MPRFGIIYKETDIDQTMRQYEHMRHANNWCPTTDIDWGLVGDFDEETRGICTALALQGSYTEEVGLLVAARLIEMVEDLPMRYCLGVQAADEAKHSEVFARYIDQWSPRIAGNAVPPQKPLKLLHDLLNRVDTIELFVLHTMLEGLAMDQFGLLTNAFKGDTLGQIYRYVRKDEARHVAMGMDFLNSALRRITPDEALTKLEKCRAELFTIAHVDDTLFDCMAKLTGCASSDINRRITSRAESRFEYFRDQLKED